MRKLQRGEVEIGMFVQFTRQNMETVQGEVTKLYEKTQPEDKGFDIKQGGDYITFGDNRWEDTNVYSIEDVETTEEVTTQSVIKSDGIKSDGGNVWTDSHYNFDYELTPKDVEKGSIRVDAYFVNRMWKLNQADDTGAVFHCLKTLTRLSNKKNPLEREIKALFGQIKCLAKMHNVDLEGK